MKHVILCADDYGQNQAVCRGILNLLENRRLTAVSCFTNMPDWETYAAWLKPYAEIADLGLHFNLTEGHPLSKQISFAGLQSWLLKTHLSQINTQEIEDELKAQIETFSKHLGRLPAYIDGHQHIHHLPQIRKALLNVYQQYYPRREAYLRIAVGPLLSAFPKSLIIAFTGALALQKHCRKLNIPHNTSFSGIYSFKHAPHYRHHFQKFLKEIENNGIIMCHPGLNQKTLKSQNISITDPLFFSRHHEYQYLSGELILKDCNRQNVQLVRFSTA